jgi:putative ABC transport system permease protein
LYLPYGQAPNPVQDYVIRVAGDPIAAVPQLKAAVATIAPGIKVEGIGTMNEIVGRVLAPWRFSTIVVSVFGIMALAFAAVGLAALIAYAVTQRTREIGVRMALGARPRDVVTLLVKEGWWMTLAGLAIGMFTAWTLRRSVASMLFGVSPQDAATFGTVPLVLVAVALIAAYIPARRAARIDPSVALRSE